MQDDYFINNGVIWNEIVQNFGRAKQPPFTPITAEKSLEEDIHAFDENKNFIYYFPKQKLDIPEEMKELFKPVLGNYVLPM